MRGIAALRRYRFHEWSINWAKHPAPHSCLIQRPSGDYQQRESKKRDSELEFGQVSKSTETLAIVKARVYQRAHSNRYYKHWRLVDKRAQTDNQTFQRGKARTRTQAKTTNGTRAKQTEQEARGRKSTRTRAPSARKRRQRTIAHVTSSATPRKRTFPPAVTLNFQQTSKGGKKEKAFVHPTWWKIPAAFCCNRLGGNKENARDQAQYDECCPCWFSAINYTRTWSDV